MIDMQEREEQAVLDEKLAFEKATHNALMKEANLDGVESLLDDMIREDPEWGRFVQVRGVPGVWEVVCRQGKSGAGSFPEPARAAPSPLHGHALGFVQRKDSHPLPFLMQVPDIPSHHAYACPSPPPCAGARPDRWLE